jgi:hypothetical protein
MPDPLPPTVAIEPAGYLCDGFLRTKEEIGAKFKDGRCHEVEPLYRRDAIAPLRVPLVDQHNNVMGHEHRKARELLIERVWTDKDGVVWSRPTAWAYYAVCEARHQWEMTAGDARSILAMLADAKTPEGIAAVQDVARAFLDKTSPTRSRNFDTAKEPT